MSVTARDIARELGLSPAAVSMALNNRPGVSAATRKLVYDTAEKLGYDLSRHLTQTSGTGSTIWIKLVSANWMVVMSETVRVVIEAVPN